MKPFSPHRQSTFTRYVLTLILLVTVTLISRSQIECPPPSTESAGWPQDSVVRYDVSSLPPTIRAQAIAALNAWTAANGSNNSGVTFVAADSNHPANLTFQVGVPQNGGAAGVKTNNAEGSSSLATAAITINAAPTNTTFFNPSVGGYNAALLKAFLHEIGHTMGLGDVPVPNNSPSAWCGGQTGGQSVMNAFCGVNDSGGNMPSSIKPCDQGSVYQNPQYYRTPCPSTECNEGSGVQVDMCSYPGAGGCPPGYHSAIGCCQPDVPSPILVDIDGSGFQLTDADNGVWFDFYGNGRPIKLSWTMPGSTNAWLVLDRNNNDTIDNASEMFGNYTAQPYSTDKNGFIALAEFDKSGAGGNEDGSITSEDPVFSNLRLWIDTNHNAVSEPHELHTLPQLNLKTLSLDYREAKRTDIYGNQFRYRAKVKDTHDAQLRRWAWDVFLVTQ